MRENIEIDYNNDNDNKNNIFFCTSQVYGGRGGGVIW